VMKAGASVVGEMRNKFCEIISHNTIIYPPLSKRNRLVFPKQRFLYQV
jgi:hypothetical protein